MQWAIRTVAAVIVVVAVCAHPVRAQLLDRAEELLQAGKCRQAEIILSNVVLQKPTSFRAHLLLGEARYRQGELDGAAEALTKANSLKPGDPSVAALLGYVHFSRENWHQAIQHLEKATAGGVSAAQAWYRLGKAYEQTDQTNKARDTYYTGAIRNMDYAPLLVALARSEKKLGNIPEAAYWYRRATAAKPDDRALFFEMVNALADAESYLQAESALTKYIDRHPEDPKALLLLAEIYGKLGLTLEQRETFRALEELGKLSTDQRVELLQAYMDYAAWEDALKLYKKLLEDGVDRADVHRAAGIAHAALGNMDSAMEALSAAVRLSPKPDTIELLAGAYFQAGKPTEAFEQYRRLVQMNPTPEILQAAADAALRANLPGRAVPLLMRLAATDPDDPHLRVRVAKAAEKSGDIREALLQWQMALRLADGDFPTARIAISRLALTCGYRPWALQEFRRLPWGEMGGRDLLEASELAAGMGDRETMLQALRSAWEDTEASPDLRLEAAGRLLDEKEPVKLSEVHEVWRISTHPPHLDDIYARYLLDSHEYGRAMSVCRQTLSDDPLAARAYVTLIDAAERAGTPQKATDAITAVIGSSGINPVAVDFLRVAYQRGRGEETAAREMLALLRLHPKSSPVLASTARALEQAELWAQAAQVYEELAKISEGAAADAARAYLQADMPQAAIAVALDNLPDMPYRDRVMAVIGEHSGTKIAQSLTDLLEVEPGSPRFYLSLARMFVDTKSVDTGLALLQALSDEKDVVEAHAGAAYLLHARGEPTAALAHIAQLSADARLIADIAVLEAECRLELGQHTAALAAVSDGGTGRPMLAARAHEIAGQAAAKQQMTEEALHHFAGALALNIDSEKASEGILQLCRSGEVTLTQLRRQLTSLYRRANQPEAVRDLAAQIAAIEGFNTLQEWVDRRQETGTPPE